MRVAREDTLQQLDPLGSVATRVLTLVACAGVVVLACIRTVAQREDLGSDVVAILALIALSIAAIHLAVRSSPLRMPFGRRQYVVVLSLALLALTFNAASLWLADRDLHEDWGPPAVGFLCLVMSPYRPPRELAAGGVLAAIYSGMLALLQALQSPDSVPAVVQVGVTVTPILGLSIGGAVFAGTMIAVMKRWQARSQAEVRELDDDRLGGLVRSVQEERVTILNRDVVPFFEDILHRKRITQDDRARASAIADRIRSAMVAEVDRSWLDLVVELDPASGPVRDPQRLAPVMSAEQRTALRAAVVAVFDEPAYVRGTLDIEIARSSDGCRVSVSCEFTELDSARRASLAPYLAVLRVVFADLSAEFNPPALTVRFTYDQR